MAPKASLEIVVVDKGGAPGGGSGGGGTGGGRSGRGGSYAPKGQRYPSATEQEKIDKQREREEAKKQRAQERTREKRIRGEERKRRNEERARQKKQAEEARQRRQDEQAARKTNHQREREIGARNARITALADTVGLGGVAGRLFDAQRSISGSGPGGKAGLDVSAVPVGGDTFNIGKAGAGASAGGMARLAAAAGPAAIAIGAIAVGAGAAGFALKKMADTFEAEANRLSGLSGPLANATARSDIRRELADLRRARRIGPQLADFEDMRSRGETAVADIQTEIYSILLDIYKDNRGAFEAVVDLLGQIAKLLDKASPVISWLGSAAGRSVIESIPGIGPYLNKILTVLNIMNDREADNEEDDDGMFDRYFMQLFESVNMPIPGAPNQNPPAGGRP